MFLPLHLRVQNTPNLLRLTNITNCRGNLIDIFTASTLNIALANLVEKELDAENLAHIIYRHNVSFCNQRQTS
jgi:hypothetical protein